MSKTELGFVGLNYNKNNKNLMDDLKTLIKDGVNPSQQKNWALTSCAEEGRLEELKFLIKDKRVDVTSPKNLALEIAFNFGQTHVVDFLLTIPEVVKNINSTSIAEEILMYISTKKMGKFKDLLDL